MVPSPNPMSNFEERVHSIMSRYDSLKTVMDDINVDIYKDPKFRILYYDGGNDDNRDAYLKRMLDLDDKSFVLTIIIDAISSIGFSEARFAPIRQRLSGLLESNHDSTIELLRMTIGGLSMLFIDITFEYGLGGYMAVNCVEPAKKKYLFVGLTLRALKMPWLVDVREEGLRRTEYNCQDVIYIERED